MRAYQIILAAAVVALAACSQEATTTAENEKGSYGSSSGPNPNLADIQNDAANTYPSQAQEGSVATTPGAEGGRSSARTGATEGTPEPQNPNRPPGATDPIQPGPTQ